MAPVVLRRRASASAAPAIARAPDSVSTRLSIFSIICAEAAVAVAASNPAATARLGIRCFIYKVLIRSIAPLRPVRYRPGREGRDPGAQRARLLVRRHHRRAERGLAQDRFRPGAVDLHLGD